MRKAPERDHPGRFPDEEVLGARSWPIRCPVDQRWLTADTPICPECGTRTDALVALNALAGRLLERAAKSGSADTAIELVAEAATLTPSMEAFEVASADSLAQVGRPDLAAERIEVALRLAPRRADLAERLQALRATPWPPPIARSERTFSRWAPVVVGVMIAGASLVALVAGRPGPPQVAVASSAPSASAAGPEATPPPSPGPTQPSTPAPSPPVVTSIRRALAADPKLADLPISVEESSQGTIRVAGVVPDEASREALFKAVIVAAVGRTVDASGVMVLSKRVLYVQRGDTLWALAARAYGDPTRWKAILDANLGLDPQTLRVGTRVVIP